MRCSECNDSPGLNHSGPPGLNRSDPPGHNHSDPPGLNHNVPPGINYTDPPGLEHNDSPETPADTNPRNRIESVGEEYATLHNILGPLTSRQAELHLELQSALEDLAKHKGVPATCVFESSQT